MVCNIANYAIAREHSAALPPHEQNGGSDSDPEREKPAQREAAAEKCGKCGSGSDPPLTAACAAATRAIGVR